MRYIILPLLLLLLAGTELAGQTTLTLKSQGGRAWQNYGDDFPINGYDQYITHYGFSAELFKSVNSYLSIGAAPGFMRRGAACEPGFFTNGDRIIDPNLPIDATIYLNYLQLPFLARAETAIWGKLELTAQGGAGFSYLLSGFRELVFLPGFGGDDRLELDFSGADSNLNRFDFGWTSSLGFAYPLGKGKLRISGEHYYSFLDMNQNNTSLNRNWAVGLAYQFTLGSQ